MPPIYTYNNAILVSNGGIAASDSCCCTGTGVAECCAFYLMMSHPSGYAINYCPDLEDLGPYDNSQVIVNEFFIVENYLPTGVLPGDSGCQTRQDAEDLANQIKSEALNICPDLVEVTLSIGCITPEQT